MQIIVYKIIHLVYYRSCERFRSASKEQSMTKLINVRFFKDQYGGNCAKSNDKDFPAGVNGSVASNKKKLIAVLRSRMGRFYPGKTFIFNFGI